MNIQFLNLKYSAMLQTFWKTEIGSCSVTPLRARPHLWAAFLQAQSGAGRCEANAWAMDVSSWLIGPQKSKCLGVLSRRFFVNAKVVIVSCQHAMKLPLVPLRWCFAGPFQKTLCRAMPKESGGWNSFTYSHPTQNNFHKLLAETKFWCLRG